MWLDLGAETLLQLRLLQAMQLVVRYGDKIWDKFPEPPENPGGMAV